MLAVAMTPLSPGKPTICAGTGGSTLFEKVNLIYIVDYGMGGDVWMVM